MEALAARALTAARREVGRRAAAGACDAVLAVDALAEAVEADPAAQADLEAAVAERRRQDPLGEAWRATGARAERSRRLAEAGRAIGGLVLAGELSPDGPGRVRLPGFGGSTWRAVALLRAGAGGPEGRWAATVAAPPAADLGDACPAYMRGLRPDPALAPAAARMHRAEALRQDWRHALLTTAAAAGAAAGAGHAVEAEALRTECAGLEALIARADREIAAAWEAGLAAAGAT